MNKAKISIFETFDSDPKAISLRRWIAATMNGNSKFAKQVKQYRETGNDNIKKSLPLTTVGALCEDGRKLENVKHRTGWIALDIDAKDNPHLEDAEAVRDAISNIVYVAFAGLSVSGTGVWALVKVENPQKQDQHFEQLQKDFLKRGIVLDSTKGKNPNDARFYSYDPEAYITKEFKVYDRLPTESDARQRREPSYKFTSNKSCNNTREKVERLIKEIQQQRIDITPGYENWISLAFALEDEFGESGRDYFHAISEFNPEYDKRECDRQFTKCVRHKGRGISIGTFFHKCREYGIMIMPNHVDAGDNGSQSEYESRKNDNPAPYGMSPFTGEVFDKRGYPGEWDNIQLDENDPVYHEATRHVINDADEDELKELTERDPTIERMINLFDGEVKTATDLLCEAPI
jgi:hypothetical protein